MTWRDGGTWREVGPSLLRGVLIVVAGAAILGALIAFAVENELHDWDSPGELTTKRMQVIAGAVCDYTRSHGRPPPTNISPVELFGPSVSMGHGPGAPPDLRENFQDGWGQPIVLEAAPNGFRILAQSPPRSGAAAGSGAELVLRVVTVPPCHVEQ